MEKKKIPHTLIIVSIILIIFLILTWIIPSGEFDRHEYNGRQVVVPGTYHQVESQPQDLVDLFTAPIKGMISAAQIIAFVLLIGGAFGILNKTGAINAGLAGILETTKKNPAIKKFIIPIIMFLFSLAGASFGMCEEVMVFILITIPLSIAMGYDSLTGIAMPFIGAASGFAGAFSNPFTIGIAQGIAEIPVFSGWEYRIAVWLVLMAAAITFVMVYARRIEKNPEKSLVYEIDRKRDLTGYHTDEDLAFTFKRKMVLVIFFASLVLLIIGVNIWGWYINEIAGLFIAMGLLAALFFRLPSNTAVGAFLEGARDMMTAALVIGLTRGMLIIATDGKIIDTILNGIAGTMGQFPQVVSVQMMFFFQGFMNFFVPSGSGQAALTMPLMAPLSDLIGISRQTAVLAYQLGDGLFTNIFPTSGVTMGILAIGNIPYDKWIRFMLPLSLLFLILGCLLLIPPVLLFMYH
ncbi:MAG TPA: AbgT family transporter [Bacteroidales bacterium]|nr:AbgT family transporter [Bacteroidales bacterium]HPT10458.1 AbgT family transporter [Bacteroidales bacterium]